MSCCRSTSSRSAWRTLTSLKGGTSTRMVNGVIAPVCAPTAVTLLPGDDPPERVDDVVGGERLAAVEGDAGPELDDELGGRPRRDRLGEHVLGPRVDVELDQGVVERLGAGGVEIGEPVVRVE